MSMRRKGSNLYWVRRLDGSDGHLFVGTVQQMGRHINACHRATGRRYAARQVG